MAIEMQPRGLELVQQPLFTRQQRLELMSSGESCSLRDLLGRVLPGTPVLKLDRTNPSGPRMVIVEQD